MRRKLQTVYEMFILNLIQATCWNRGRLHILFFYYSKCLKVTFKRFPPPSFLLNIGLQLQLEAASNIFSLFHNACIIIF